VSPTDPAGPLRLNCEERGEGRPIVILHGLLGSLANWRGIARTLSATWRVVSFDARNHGRSPHSALHDYPAMAEDVAGMIEAMTLGPVVVLGHSMGGKTAMRLALNRPDLVSGLLVVDMAPRAYPLEGGPVDVIAALRRIDLSSVNSREEVDRRLASEIPDAATRNFAMMNLYRSDQGFAWRCNLAGLARSTSDIAAPIESEGVFGGPARFIRGAWSRYVTESDEVRIRELFPAASIVTVAAAGHWLHVEAPASLVGEIQSFGRLLPR
jgi:esterase